VEVEFESSLRISRFSPMGLLASGCGPSRWSNSRNDKEDHRMQGSARLSGISRCILTRYCPAFFRTKSGSPPCEGCALTLRVSYNHVCRFVKSIACRPCHRQTRRFSRAKRNGFGFQALTMQQLKVNLSSFARLLQSCRSQPLMPSYMSRPIQGIDCT